MSKPNFLVWQSLVVIAAFVSSVAFPARSSAAESVGTVERVQSIQLKKGWNSVFLQVEPGDPDPAVVFAELPISQAAAWFQKATPLEYISDPDSEPWNEEGWGVWYAPGRPDAFLKTLHAVHGNAAYLIKADRDFTWSLRGEVRALPIIWKANSYNHVGFALDAQSPPLFADFFQGAKAQVGMNIYRLEGGRWRKVAAGQEQMRDGEAYWVYSKGGSTFQGPLEVKLAADSLQALVFPLSGASSFSLVNRSTAPIDINFEHSDDLPLRFVAKVLDEETKTSATVSSPFNSSEQMTALGAGQTFSIQLELDRAQMGSRLQQGLLKITSSVGTVNWVQMIGSNPSIDE